MKRVFYFTNHQLTVFNWTSNHNVERIIFTDDDNGYSQFETYLQTLTAVPTRMLVDRIDEDFHIEALPHTPWYYRSSVLKRHLKKWQRNHPFVVGTFQNTQRGKPKKDIYLFTYLQQSEALNTWLDPIRQANIWLEGIWSLPRISQVLYRYLKPSEPHTLLVTQQMNRTVRLSYFDDQKLKVSREAQLPDYHHETDSVEQFSAWLHKEIGETDSFLRNQKFIYKEKIQVILLLADAFHTHITDHCISHHSIEYHVHSLEDIAKKIGFPVYRSQTADELMCWLCLQVETRSQHYANHREQLAYFNYKQDQWLQKISMACCSLALLSAVGLYYQATVYQQKTDKILEKVADKAMLYRQQYTSIEDILIHSEEIHKTVALSQEMTQHNANSPLLFNFLLSQSLQNPEFNNIEIESIVWQRIQAEHLLELKQAKEADDQNDSEEISVSGFNTNVLYGVATIEAKLPYNERQYRYMLNQVENWITQLKSIEGVSDVETISLPVEIRSHKSFEGRSGVLSLVKEAERYAGFKIKVLLTEVFDVS